MDQYTALSSQVNEQANAGLQRKLAYMSVDNFMFHLCLFLKKDYVYECAFPHCTAAFVFYLHGVPATQISGQYLAQRNGSKPHFLPDLAHGELS